MKQVIKLDNGTIIESEGNRAKFIDVVGNVLYDTAEVSKDVQELPYFFLMGEYERKKVAEWFNEVNPKVEKKKKRQRKFLNRVRRALKLVDYDYYIATLEPSFDEKGKIFYREGEVVGREIKVSVWKKRAKFFYSKDGWNSELAHLEEGDLFKAYRIAEGYWTIEYVCDDSSSEGNYHNSPRASCGFQVSGARDVGGFKDGIGNTYQIYQTKLGFAIVGGHCFILGSRRPVAFVDYWYNPSNISSFGTGVVVIKKS